MLCLAATALLTQGCVQQTAGPGIFTIDTQGGAKTCVASNAAPPDGQAVLAQMQVSDEGGWCGILANHNGAAFDSYLMEIRPSHGTIYAHHVGNNTRIDYTPETGFVGTDRFSVRLIPGNAVIESAVTVVR
jgi:hypothetical protein